LPNFTSATIIMQMATKSRKHKDDQTPRAANKKAYRNFELIDRFEAGLELLGAEVKSLRSGQADLDGSYARIKGGECWLVGAKIAPYQSASWQRLSSYDTSRNRKLLLHKNEIHRIKTKLEQRGFTLVPLTIYFNNRGLAKIELALARGKRQYDKRKAITERQHKRDIDRNTKKYRR